MRFSTSRAPGSVFEYFKGVSPPRAFFAVVSHWTADATSPSNSSTALSKTVESLSRRSDSSGASLPAALRRATVRSGMPRIEMSTASATPEFASNRRRESKGNPSSNCSIRSAVSPVMIPRLAPRVRRGPRCASDRCSVVFALVFTRTVMERAYSRSAIVANNMRHFGEDLLRLRGMLHVP
jgi:hypothetical protein